MEERSKCESFLWWVDRNSTYASTVMSAGWRTADESMVGVEAEDLFLRWTRGELLPENEVGVTSRGKRIAIRTFAPSSESICVASSSWAPHRNSGEARTVNRKEKYSLRLRCRSRVSDRGRQPGVNIGLKADFIQPIIVVHMLDRNMSLYDIALRNLMNALNRGSQRSIVHGASKSSKQARTSELEVNVVSELPQYAARIS